MFQEAKSTEGSTEKQDGQSEGTFEENNPEYDNEPKVEGLKRKYSELTPGRERKAKLKKPIIDYDEEDDDL